MLEGFKKAKITEILKYSTVNYKNQEMKNFIRRVFAANGITEQEAIEYFNNDDKAIEEAIDNPLYYVQKTEDGIKRMRIMDLRPTLEVMYSENEHSEEEHSEEEHSEEEHSEEEHSEEEHSDETMDIEKLSPKGKKLLLKVDKLCEKIYQEKNPIKLQLLKFRVRRLQTMIQRELDLINIKEDFEAKKSELRTNKEENESQNEIEIARLSAQIKRKRKFIQSNSECDYESSDFMYDEKTIERNGGLENLAKKLKENPDADVQYTGKRIEEMLQARKELKELQKQYEERQELLASSEASYKSDEKALKSEERRLIVANRFNIFSKIGDFLKNIGEGIKDIRAKREEMRQLREEYKQAKAESKAEAKARDEALKQKYEEARQENTSKRNSEFLRTVKLTGKDLENANSPSPVQTDEVIQEGEEQSPKGAEPVIPEGNEL